MLKLNSFFNECCLKGYSMGLKVKRNKINSPVLRTPGSFDSPIHKTPGSHFKNAYNSAKKQKNQNGPRTSLMGPGGVVWGKIEYKKSRETVPLNL